MVSANLGQERFPSSCHLRWIATLLLGYFGIRLLFFATTIAASLPPDEATHFGLCKIFSRGWWLPGNSPDTYRFGLVTNIPWLYYWIMGKLLVFNVFAMADLLFLRLLNIPLAFATLYFVWRTLRLVSDDRLTQVLLIVAMTNTLMFSFLSASVSYDNLTNLLAAMAVYSLLAFFRERSGNLLMLSWCCQLLGCLTKTAFLPLALILNMLLLAKEYRAFSSLPSAAVSHFKSSGRRGRGLLLVCLVGLLLNLQLYGGNLLRYGNIAPEMWEVLPIENAMQYRLAARNLIFDLFKGGRVSFEEALAMTSSIEHSGDREDAVGMLQDYNWRQYSGEKLMNPLEFVVPWGQSMLSSIFGVAAHIPMFNGWPTILPVLALVLLTSIAVALRWRPKGAGWLVTSLVLIVAGYATFLLYAVNYRDYLHFESYGMAMQGRYLFPVLGPMYVLASLYLMKLFRWEWARRGLAILSAVILLASDFPFFLLHVSPEWFAITFW